MFSAACRVRRGNRKVQTFKLILHKHLFLGHNVARETVQSGFETCVSDLGADGPVRREAGPEKVALAITCIEKVQ